MRNSIRKTLIGAASFVFVCAIGATGLINTSATAETPVLAGTNTTVLTQEIADNALTGFQIYGASVRQNDPAGIRFLTILTESDLAQIPSTNVTFGTLLLPKDMLATDELLTVDTQDVLVTKATTPCTDAEVPEGGLGYFVTLVGNGLTAFPESLYDEDFAARSYVKYTYEKDGETVEDIVYSSQESRSMTYVASAELYKNPNTDSDSLLNKIVATKANVNLAINDNEPEIGFQTGETATVEVSGNEGLKYKLTSSNEAVAKVDQDGTLTAVGPGKATITASIGAISASEEVSVHASLDMLKQGVTYDWTNTSMPITSSSGSENGTIVAVEDIENADAKAAIQGASEGFTTNVNHVTGDNQHNLLGLYRGYGNLQPGYVYTIEVYYYAVSATNTNTNTNDYIIALGDNNSNATLQENPFDQGLSKLTFEYACEDAAKFVLTFWTNGTSLDVYLGNMTISAMENSYYKATDADIFKDGGYTYDFSKGNLLPMQYNAVHIAIDSIKDSTLKTKLEETKAFTSGYALKLAKMTASKSCFIVPLQKQLVANAEYTISFTAYEVNRGSLTILLMNANKGQAGQTNFTIADNNNGTLTYTATFTAADAYMYINPYIISDCELYLANFTIERGSVPTTLVEKTTSGSKTASELKLSSQSSMSLVSTPEAAKNQTGFGDQAVQITNDSTDTTYELCRLSGSSYTGIAGYKNIKITLYYYVAEKTSDTLYIQMDSTFLQLSGTNSDVGYHAYTFTVDHTIDYFCIHYSGATFGTIYIGSMDYIVTYETAE